MSRKSETVILREELARLAVENQGLRGMESRLEATFGGRVASLGAEIDQLGLEIA